MVHFENTAYYCMRIAKRMNKQPNEEIDHKSQNVRVLAQKHNRLLLQNHAVNLIE